LTVDLLRELGRTRPEARLRFSSVGTTSLSALKAFLQGEQSFRRSAWDSATVHYERAVALDTAFVLALWRLALAKDWAGGDWSRSLLLSLRAGRFNHGLSPHDSLLVTADSLRAAYYDTLDSGYWSHLLRRFSTLEEATRRYPEDPATWYELGEARFHNGIAVGSTAQQTLEAFDRAIALDSGFGAAYIHPIQLALESAGPVGAEPYIEGYLASASDVAEGEGIRLVAPLLVPGSAPSGVVRRLADTASASSLLGAAVAMAGWADSNETALQLLKLMAEEHRMIRGPVDTVSLDELLASTLTYRGHLREARAVVGDGFGHPFVELAQLGVIPPDTADAVIARWFRSSDDPALRFGKENVDRCRRTLGAAQWWAARGDSTSLLELVRRGVAAAAPGSNVYAQFNTQGDIALGRVGLALARRDTAEALRRVLGVPDSLCPGFVPFRLFKAHLLAEAGRDREAAVLFDRTPSLHWLDRSVGSALAVLQRGRVAERLRDREKAIQCYQLVLDLWRHADPELQPYVEEARAGLARVATGESAQ
jgi:tetratricopeptide (TPR) repeat protein